MEYLIVVLVCFFSSAVGAVCGIGGGVIIKPALDAVGLIDVTTVSFLSGCTVLSMSFTSLYRNLRERKDAAFDKIFATVLALGSVAGGMAGKEIYQDMISRMADSSRIGSIQAGILALITAGTLLYILFKKKIRTKEIKNKAVIFGIGIVLGMLSSFLGIGGGPVNLVVLFYFFSMETKQAALHSIYVILFSQSSSLLSTLIKRNAPPFEPWMLLLMIGCGILGGLAGCRINRKVRSETVDRLFMGLLGVIICISVYNVFRYL